MRKLAWLLGGAVLSLLGGGIDEAHACGGCFHPEDQPLRTLSMVTGHRMALAISMDGSVLWDQVQYSGSPEEFAWVLPVKPGATLEVSSDAWFETLDAATTVRVAPPSIQCEVPGTPDTVVEEEYYENDYSYGNDYAYGCQISPALSHAGCAADGAADGDPTAHIREITIEGEEPGSETQEPPPPEPVGVVHEGSAGPYETVTIHSNVPGAATQWLLDHGFAIDEDIAPVLEAYEEEGFDFIALRLLPDVGVQQMRPVRVHMPGSVTTLPLRMVAAGTGANVGLTLFVIGEGRWTMANFPSTTIEEGIDWDFATSMSTYRDLRDEAFAEVDGRTWLTSYAVPGALFAPLINPINSQPVSYTTPLFTTNTIADAYASQGLSNAETTETCIGKWAALATATGKVVNPCDENGCGEVGPTEIDARLLECGELFDLRAAVTGMHPRDVWLTRLDSFLPREALDADLLLGPAQQYEVPNWLVADTYSNPPCVVVGANETRARVRGASIPVVAILMAWVAAIAGARRFRTRHRSL